MHYIHTRSAYIHTTCRLSRIHIGSTI
uniref:Uncharacterized protein n=1 Tax=Arundo donax TaxID=35708 RepID=A0A0A8ZXR6_ARUDO